MPEGESLPAGGPGRTDLTGSLNIREAEQIRSRLLEAVRQHEHVMLGCSGAAGGDLSFVQLVLSARRTAAAAGKSVTLAAPAEGWLLEALQKAGLVSPAGQAPAAGQEFWL
jgi:hypothetical protein